MRGISLVFAEEFPDQTERDICKRYWERSPAGAFTHPVKALAKAARERENTFDYFVVVRCAAVSHVQCACGAPYIYESRRDFQAREHLETWQWKCETCTREQIDAENRARALVRAEASEAAAARIVAREAVLAANEATEAAQQDRLRQRVRRAWPLGEPVDPCSVHLRHIAPWFALLGKADLNSGRLPALDELGMPLIGEIKADVQAVRHLRAQRLLYLDTEGTLSPFSVRRGRAVAQLRAVGWRLAAPQYEALARKYTADALRIVPNPAHWPTWWQNQYVDLFSEIAGAECWRQWYKFLRRHDMKVVDREELADVLDEALTVFSVGQVACLMWRSVMKSLDIAKHYDASWIKRETNIERIKFRHHFQKKKGRWALNCFAGLVRYWSQRPDAVKTFKITPRGMVTTVGLGIMSGVHKPWYAVRLIDVDTIVHRARGARAVPMGWR
ncbi:hypothetical protein [Polyangium jinanense]|uniref:Uncharacterized protein n=1 Tax=Polyangium jinanense TaxID=2829994 RepID=A0A9X4AWG2_9BACT|nr:hypothetical protein [Polyangium jinanense]MDC3987308.1 hypothetical protein [Polyangium jinanense]